MESELLPVLFVRRCMSRADHREITYFKKDSKTRLLFVGFKSFLCRDRKVGTAALAGWERVVSMVKISESLPRSLTP